MFASKLDQGPDLHVGVLQRQVKQDQEKQYGIHMVGYVKQKSPLLAQSLLIQRLLSPDTVWILRFWAGETSPHSSPKRRVDQLLGWVAFPAPNSPSEPPTPRHPARTIAGQRCSYNPFGWQTPRRGLAELIPAQKFQLLLIHILGVSLVPYEFQPLFMKIMGVLFENQTTFGGAPRNTPIPKKQLG